MTGIKFQFPSSGKLLPNFWNSQRQLGARNSFNSLQAGNSYQTRIESLHEMAVQVSIPFKRETPTKQFMYFGFGENPIQVSIPFKRETPTKRGMQVDHGHL